MNALEELEKQMDEEFEKMGEELKERIIQKLFELGLKNCSSNGTSDKILQND